MVSNCSGWWQQAGLGRQPMRELKLEIDQHQLRGSGIDVIGPFSFAGQWRGDGNVEILKRYHGQHSVLYVGRYDGEGTLYGRWDIRGVQGKWAIRIERASDQHPQEIAELVPLNNQD